jgi:hypothetical protein
MLKAGVSPSYTITMPIVRTFKLAVLGAIYFCIILACVSAQSSPALPTSSAIYGDADVIQGSSVDTAGALTISLESVSDAYESSGTEAYENTTYGFTMSYPQGWLSKEPDANDLGMVVGFLAPGGDVDNPTSYVTVQMESLPSDQQITLDKYTSAITSNLKSAYKRFKLLSKRNITVSILPGKEILYTLDDSGTPYEILLQYTVQGDEAYVLSYYAPEERYTQFEDGARAIMGSFQFSGAKSEPKASGSPVAPLPFSKHSN